MTARGCLCVIPARGGSKRLPRKNVALVAGKPLISYSIVAAQESRCFRRILVSTEDSRIAAVAEEYGATVSRRDPELASDTATVADVCLDLLRSEAEAGRHYETVCVLYATAPRRTAEDVRAVIRLLDDPECDFAFAATTYDHPVPHALAQHVDGTVKVAFPDLMERPPRDLPRYIVGNGSTYAAKVNAFLESKTWYGERMRAYMMPRSRSVDIDTPEDLQILRAFMEKETKAESVSEL